MLENSYVIYIYIYLCVINFIPVFLSLLKPKFLFVFEFLLNNRKKDIFKINYKKNYYSQFHVYFHGNIHSFRPLDEYFIKFFMNRKTMILLYVILKY
jgi:hypothetical protein